MYDCFLEKSCTKCRESKPLDAYHRSNYGGRLGYTSECKQCHLVRMREYRARIKKEVPTNTMETSGNGDQRVEVIRYADRRVYI